MSATPAGVKSIPNLPSNTKRKDKKLETKEKSARDASVGSLFESGPLRRDDYFYFENVIFKAGNTGFKVVPQYNLPIEDKKFAAWLKSALSEKQPHGPTEQDPISLPAEVTSADFRSLLKACNPNFPGTTLTLHEWTSVLKLGKTWSLDSLRHKAIEEAERLLSTQSPLEKVLLGKECTVSKWLIEGYEAFGMRDEMITAVERAKLGIDTFVGLVELRERAATRILQDAIRTMSGTRDSLFGLGYPAGYADPTYTPSTFKRMFDYRSAIREIFANELKQDGEYDS